jgi:predicted ATPase
MKLSVEGYKSIASKKDILFPGLTILAGSNSSGKSSFMQPFLILKQTVENHYDTGSLLLDGENIKLTDASQIFSRIPGKKKKSFSIYISEAEMNCEIVYKYKRNIGIVADSVYLEDKEKYQSGLTLRIGMKSDEISRQVPDDQFKSFRDFIGSQGFDSKWRTVLNKCFIHAELNSANARRPLPINVAIHPAGKLEETVTKLIHVPGLRGNPERTYKIAAAEDVYPGSFEKYIASIITEWNRLKIHAKKFSELKKQLQALGLTTGIDTSKVNDTRVEIRVSRNKTEDSDYINIADVGFGVSQTLPVLVALLCARKGQLVYIEQPELHLHPGAQFKLARIIAESVNRGVKVVIETHSSMLLRGIQIEVVKQRLEFDKVSLNWFTQNPLNGETEISTANLDKYGAFGDWPEDFDDVTLKAEQIYLDAIEEALSGKQIS